MTLFIHAITGHNNLNYMNSIIKQCEIQGNQTGLQTVLNMAKMEDILLAMNFTEEIVKNRRK